MVACELDNEVAGEVLGWKLPTWQALLLHRVLPSCGGLVVYLTLMCYDFALIYEHYQYGDKGIGAFCILLTVFPALLALVFTLASPPPGLETEQSAFTVTVQKNDVRWIVMQFVNCIFFPIAAIGRYCHQIFWWVEAVCASRVQDETRTQDALSRARTASPVELYLFLQAFIHSAPHAIVNILDLMSRFQDPAFDKVSVQAVSIVASTLRMASVATLYRRFEREKLSGRKYPWNFKTVSDETADNKETVTNKIQDTEEHIYEPIMKKQSFSSQKVYERPNTQSDMIQFSPMNQDTSPWFDDDMDNDSGTSSDYLPPEPRNASQRSLNSDDEYVRPISIIDKVAPRRRDTSQYTIERVAITPPPVIPAPRPGSFAVWAEKFVENAESLPMWLSAPPRRKQHEMEVIQDEPDIPIHVPRSYKRGLEPQDATAALVQYLGWYAFFVSRLLSIAVFISFSPVAAIVVLISHYQVMLLFLIVPQAPTVKRGFYIFLAFIYLFCLMEFKIRFRHVRVWHVFWIIVCTIETVVFTGLWFSIGNDLGNWWRSYITNVIWFSLIMSYMCFMVYFVLLKPRETIVYVNNRDSVKVTKHTKEFKSWMWLPGNRSQSPAD